MDPNRPMRTTKITYANPIGKRLPTRSVPGRYTKRHRVIPQLPGMVFCQSSFFFRSLYLVSILVNPFWNFAGIAAGAVRDLSKDITEVKERAAWASSMYSGVAKTVRS